MGSPRWAGQRRVRRRERDEPRARPGRRPLDETDGIAAGRRLGSRLASFVALLEVLSAVVFAWLLLGAGIYPVIGLSAWLYIRTAARNEARYRDLAEDQ